MDLSRSLRNLTNLQREDKNIKVILDQIENNNNFEFFIVKNDILFRHDKILHLWQVEIPVSLTNEIINCVHSKLGHPGVYKTLMYLKQFYYWKKMGPEVKQFVLSCDLCQRIKSLNIKMEGAFNIVESSEPGNLVCVDFYGPLPRSVGGVQYIFVVLDAFTKYVKLYPIKRETTEIVLKKLCEDYFVEMGKPKRLLADHGSQFTSQKWAKKLDQLGIKFIFSSVRHPQGNPVERVMRELGRLFRTLCSEKHTRWGKQFADIEFFLNVTTHHSTGFSPFELQFGVKPSDPVQKILSFPVAQDISRDAKVFLAREKINQSFKKRARTQKLISKVILKEGDLVLLHIPKISDACRKVTKKFFHIYYGPYVINKDFQNNAYELALPEEPTKIIGVHNRYHIKNYRTSHEVCGITILSITINR